MSSEAPVVIGSEPHIHTSTNQLNETDLAAQFFNESGAGASIGGAAWRAGDEQTAIPDIWSQLLPDTQQTFSNITIEPYTGFLGSPEEQAMRDTHPETDFVLASNPKPDADDVLTYEMIYEQLTNDPQFMDGVQKLMSNPSVDAFINSHHFYITPRILDAAKDGVPDYMLDRVIDVQRFHSLLSLTTRDLYRRQMGVSIEEANAYLTHIGISPERIAYEAHALGTGFSIYSTAWERDNTVASYDGFKLRDGTELTAKQLKDSSLVVPLSYDPEDYHTDPSGQLKAAERKRWFPQFGIPENATFAAVLGRKDPERGYVTAFEQATQYLVSAASEMSPNELVYFGFIGGVPKKSASMMAAYNKVQKAHEEFAADHPKLAQHIRWIDRIDHKQFGHAPDIEIQLPDTESWGLHVLQAMACGKAVITSDLPTYREWAADGVVSINQRDQSAFAAAINQLNNPRAREEQGVKAAKRAARYTHDRSMSIMLAQIMAKTGLVQKIQQA